MNQPMAASLPAYGYFSGNLMTFKTLQVILKVSERCNLACSYCYYFYAGDDSYTNRPPLMKSDTAASVADFLAQGARELNINHIIISFHGGEPLLLKPEKFDEFCGIFRRAMPDVSLGFIVQTNGVLINEHWIEVFRRHNVCVGVSIDGARRENDKFRIANNGKGSYADVVAGLQQLQTAFRNAEPWRRPGTISVVNASFNYRKIFLHLHKELGIDEVSFLLPDVQHDTGLPAGTTARDYGKILCDIFDAWIDTGAKASVRQIERVLSFFKVVKEETIPRELQGRGRRTQIVVIQSDGELSIDDSFMVALSWRKAQETPHVGSTTLQKYLARPVFKEISDYYSNLPSACQSCCWRRLCGGGDLENRYSQANGFDNPSVYCEGLQIFYQHAVKYLVANGYPRQQIEAKLLGGDVFAEAA